ncbi:MAG: FkbM family methyltransferase [Sphingomonadales bacterium]|jgi:FkbM family methyltransferase
MQLLKIINHSWLKLISELIEWNEKMLFYPKLKKFYNDNLSWNNINVIDVGANKGQTIKFILSIRPSATIFSFESNRKLFSKGVSDKPLELVFRENLLNEISTLKEIDLNSKYLTKKARVLGIKKEQLNVDQYKIQVTTLADFIAENPGKFFELLKIDVDGHELSCLKGLFASNVLPIPLITYSLSIIMMTCI